MKSMARAGRFAILSIAAVMITACAGQKEPARKMLADIAVKDSGSFQQLVEVARGALTKA